MTPALTAAVGIAGEPSGVHSPDDVVLAVVLVLFVLSGLNTPTLRHIISTFMADLVSRRNRSNVFDNHNGATDSRIIGLLLLQTSMFEGILLAGWCQSSSGVTFPLLAAAMTGVAAGFNIFSYVACATVGYTFTSTQNAAQWRHTLSTSQGLLGIGLLIPAAVSVLWAGEQTWIYGVAVGLYVLVRICYIFKGFTFFYTDIFSSFYFILYLCALEIIPVVATLHFATAVSSAL